MTGCDKPSNVLIPYRELSQGLNMTWRLHGMHGQVQMYQYQSQCSSAAMSGVSRISCGLWRLSESVLPVTTLRHDTLPMVLSKIAALLHLVSALIVYTSLMSKMQNA